MRRLPFFLGLLAVSAAAADAPDAIRTTLIEPWVRAMRTEAPPKLARFLHPKIRACINDQTREYFESGTILKPRGGTGTYRITKAEPWNEAGPLFGAPERDFSYPVRPTFELNLQFEPEGTVVVRYLAESGGSWFLVVPCPSESGMEALRQKNVLAAAQKRRVAELLSEIQEPLLTELKTLRTQGRLLDAVKRYQQAAGVEDLTLAVMVVKAIAP